MPLAVTSSSSSTSTIRRSPSGFRSMRASDGVVLNGWHSPSASAKLHDSQAAAAVKRELGTPPRRVPAGRVGSAVVGEGHPADEPALAPPAHHARGEADPDEGREAEPHAAEP